APLMIRAAILGVALALAAVSAAGASGTTSDHDKATAALADVRAAVGEIVRIEDGFAVGHPTYLRAAHRALNALVGRRDPLYSAAAGQPGDPAGALGNVDALLDRNAEEIWTPALRGAKANLLAAAKNLQDALHEREMEEYEGDLTQALANLSLVSGRPSESGVLGGISGALGNTVLGVPSDVAMVSPCGPPAHGRAYAVLRGRLAYVAVPRSTAAGALPGELSIARVVVTPDDVLLYTAGAKQTASLCRMQRTRAVVVAAAAAAPPYTAAQAHAGARVYAAKCVQCHGANLQGTAAPGVAGREFLSSAHQNHWSLADVRSLVVDNMPLNDPGSLSPKDYAAVIAFLLQANCYPAGSRPFPTSDDPSFAKITIGPVAGAKPTNQRLGTCAAK
ncbi:MAG TPA: cytochrome c, partial [Candidatus Acidoferrum sp.]|nr:cytochrome c [Candidatus Acidoferrum sp.]